MHGGLLVPTHKEAGVGSHRDHLQGRQEGQRVGGEGWGNKSRTGHKPWRRCQAPLRAPKRPSDGTARLLPPPRPAPPHGLLSQNGPGSREKNSLQAGGRAAAAAAAMAGSGGRTSAVAIVPPAPSTCMREPREEVHRQAIGLSPASPMFSRLATCALLDSALSFTAPAPAGRERCSQVPVSCTPEAAWSPAAKKRGIQPFTAQNK